VNPSGRLCSTFDRTFEENPAFANYPGQNAPGQNYPTVEYEEGIFTGYRGYDKAGKAPLYPFGFGLSYTTFEMSNLTAKRDDTSINIALDVKNTGSRAGAEVVQIYVGEKGCPLPRPVRELKGFAKVSLEPGASRHVELVLGPDAFSYWSPDKKTWVADSDNTFTVEAAASERDIKLKRDVTLK
jgi:beta-glucosidase